MTRSVSIGSRTRVSAAAVLLGASLLVGGIASASPQPARASGLDATAQLRNAPIPASCQHPATTLDGFTKEFGDNGANGGAQLLVKQAAFGRITKHGGSDAVVPMVCSAGGVSWPMYLLVYAPGPKLIGHVWLGRMKTAQEHEDVTRLRFSVNGNRHVNARYRGYDGAGSTFTTYKGRLSWRSGKVHWRHTSPLTIDYAKGRPTDWEFGAPGVVQSPGDAKVFLFPAPTSFKRYIQHRVNSRTTGTGPCDQFFVAIDRYSHKGYAYGNEGACSGGVAAFAKRHGHWRQLFPKNEGPFCWLLTKLQRHALHATGEGCYDRQNRYHSLGHWPRSGQ